MEQTGLLLEYLKEQYAQARQHETRQTSATTFLTAAAAVLLAVMLRDGLSHPETWWIGLVVALVGLANWLINRAHYKGNRFHTTAAGKTRRALEEAISTWTVTRPTDIRGEALLEHGLKGVGISVGQEVHAALQRVPVGVMVVGAISALVIGFSGYESGISHMEHDTVVFLSIISQITGLVSILALYVASIGVPWDRQTWKGESPYEVRRRRIQILMAWIGVPCAIVAVGCQMAITLYM